MIDEEEALIKIGNRLRELRKNAGYSSYEKFAWEKGLHRQTVYRAENGKSITIRILISILNALNISMEDFFKGL